MIGKRFRPLPFYFFANYNFTLSLQSLEKINGNHTKFRSYRLEGRLWLPYDKKWIYDR